MQDITQDFHGAFSRLQKAAEDVWELVNEFACSFVVSAEEANDLVKSMQGVRDTHARAREICAALQIFATSWNFNTDGFAEKTDKFKRDTDRTARNRGLRRLPDELLVDSLDFAADSLKSSVQSLKTSALLSHVCKRFRQTLTTSSKHWTGHVLDADFPASIIFALVERCRDGQFKARIVFDDRGRPTFASIHAIVDNAARVGDLTISDERYFFEPHQRKSRPTILKCDCLPHPSLSRNLVVCTLHLRTPSLKHLLEFLSSANKLEVISLEFEGVFCDQRNAESFAPISLPSFTALRLVARQTVSVKAYRHFMERIGPFTASSLDVTYAKSGTGFDISPVVKLIHVKPSIRNLRLKSLVEKALPSIPRDIETLELSGWHVKETIDTWLRCPELFPAQNLRLLKLSNGRLWSDPHNIMRLVDYFVTIGCNEVHFQFEDYPGMKNGVYELAEVHEAAV